MASATISRDSITCPVCFDIFKNPRNLPCGHSLCYECINKIITSSLEAQRNTLVFNCPMCRIDIGIPAGAHNQTCAEHFPRNHNLHSLISDCVEESPTAVIAPKVNPSVCATHNEDKKLYCDDHRVVLCCVCVCVDHRTCDSVVTIEEAIKKLLPSRMEKVDQIVSVQKRAGALKRNVETMDVLFHSTMGMCRQKVNETCEGIISKALARQGEFHAIINEITERETRAISERKSYVENLMGDINRTRSDYEKNPKESAELLTLLNNPDNNCVDEKLIKWDEQIREICDNAQTVRLMFKPNKNLSRFLLSAKDIGEINQTDSTLPQKSALLKIDPQSAFSSVDDISAPTHDWDVETDTAPGTSRLGDDETNPVSTPNRLDGLSLISQHKYTAYPVVSLYGNDFIVVCLEHSTKLMLINVNGYTVEIETDLPFEPWDMCVYKNYVAVTHSDSKCVSILKLPSLNLKRIFSTSRRCNGIDRFKDGFLISCFYDGRLQLFSDRGKVQKETDKIFESPDCVSVCDKNDRIYVSDTTSRSIFSLNHRLQILWQFDNDQYILTYPRGLRALRSGNVLVACLWSNKIIEVDKRCRLVNTIADQNDGLVNPRMLHVNTSGTLLIVGEKNGSVKLFAMT